MGQVQLLASTGDADVRQPAFFLELDGIGHRAVVREDAILHARDEHDVELEPLGGMQRHQRDLRCVGHLVDIADQRHLLQEFVARFEVGSSAEQLFEMFETPVGLNRSFVLQPLHVPRLIQRCFQHRGGTVGNACPSTTHQLAELQQTAAGSAAHAERLEPVDHLGQRGPASRCRVVELGDRAIADAAGGQVHDPLERHLVRRVHRGTQERQRVLDLAPVVEPGAADDLVRHVVRDELLFDHA